MGTTLSRKRAYIILVRHASRDFGSNHDESRQSMVGWESNIESVSPDFEEKGLPRTLAIANRLADELDPIEVTHIWHSPHTVADQTAKAYREVVCARSQRVCSEEPIDSLEPDDGSGIVVAESLRELAKSGELDAGSAIIVVGHQPKRL